MPPSTPSYYAAALWRGDDYSGEEEPTGDNGPAISEHGESAWRARHYGELDAQEWANEGIRDTRGERGGVTWHEAQPCADDEYIVRWPSPMNPCKLMMAEHPSRLVRASIAPRSRSLRSGVASEAKPRSYGCMSHSMVAFV